MIHDEKGFKEMPILISATAVQLTFGLTEFLLPNFNEIHIYPDAFFGYDPLRVLVGNVSGNAVNISWKHYLEGVEIPNDNSNVGLHEMAHALYYQNMVSKMDENEDFAHSFPEHNKVFDAVFNIEKSIDGLYSEYGTKNFQEFWAESIEIFFENPGKMKTQYPDLYEAVCDILNLNPLNESNPVIA
jgi:Mlc titration factor MtfA (ptsG expression regulator)